MKCCSANGQILQTIAPCNISNGAGHCTIDLQCNGSIGYWLLGFLIDHSSPEGLRMLLGIAGACYNKNQKNEDC